MLQNDPALLGSAIEEMLRIESPVQQSSHRVYAIPVEIGGVEIPAHCNMIGLFGSANRDERIFTEPDRFDISRTGSRHVAFRYGPHVRLGATLARTEARIAFTQIMEQLPGLRLESSQRGFWQWLRTQLGSDGRPPGPRRNGGKVSTTAG
jgi:cytochrome P450